MAEQTTTNNATSTTPPVNTNTSQPQQQSKNMKKTKEIKMMEQRLNGVMFHVFYTDLFDLLGLKGFSDFHKEQKEKEEHSLNILKKEYIKHCKKLPILEINNESYWSKYSNFDFNNITTEQLISIVKDSMKHYQDWEKKALNDFISWDEMNIAKEIMKEIDKIEYISNLLNKYGYDYEYIMYLSNKMK